MTKMWKMWEMWEMHLCHSVNFKSLLNNQLVNINLLKS